MYKNSMQLGGIGFACYFLSLWSPPRDRSVFQINVLGLVASHSLACSVSWQGLAQHMGLQQVWSCSLWRIWLHRLLDDGALVLSTPTARQAHVQMYGNTPTCLLFRLTCWKVSPICSLLGVLLCELRRTTWSASHWSKIERFTFCFAGQTPLRLAELRDREFAMHAVPWGAL